MAPLEAMLLPTNDASRCGEIFVTNSADKWTFFCSYCQKGTIDIGVFICHIRLEHLNSPQDFQLQNRDFPPPEPGRKYPEIADSQHVSNIKAERLSPREDEQVTESYIIKEEATVCEPPEVVEVPSLTDDHEMENAFSDKNDNQTYISSDETNEEFLDILPIGEDSQEQEFTTIEENNETIHVAFNNDDEIIEIDDEDIEEILDSDEFNENNEDANTASGSIIYEKDNILQHKCQHCLRSFKSIRGLHFHKTMVHNDICLTQLKFKCKVCKRGFKSSSGLKEHLILHDKNNIIQCPVCPVTTFRMHMFLQHVMKHESDKCFPCQTCGKIYDNNEERLTHWQTHSYDKPYACNSCYRRFSHKQYLTYHLKKHGQYKCHFCPEQFVTTRSLRTPYACPDCEKMPDVKQSIELHKSVAQKNHAFELDKE